jgi:hypothetical protein
MMFKASRLAIAIAVVGPLAVAAVGESFAAPVPSSALAVKAVAPAAATKAVPGLFESVGFPAGSE